MWEMAAMAGASALGSALSGGKGTSINKQARVNRWLNKSLMEDQYWLNMRSQKEAIKQKVMGAREAGLHPLYALGSQAPSVSSSAHVSPGQEGTSDLQRMGQAISSGVSAYAQAKAAKRQNTLMEEKLRAEIGETRARTEGILSDTINKNRDFVMRAAKASQAARMVTTMDGIGARATPTKVAPMEKVGKRHSIDTPFGRLHIRPGLSTAEHVQNIGGEPAEWMYSPAMILDTLIYNATTNLDRQGNRMPKYVPHKKRQYKFERFKAL